jgi:hypothetical protein
MVNLKIKEEREKKEKKRLLVLNQSPFNNTCLQEGDALTNQTLPRKAAFSDVTVAHASPTC